jgi:2'-5' RNA ligase
LFVAVLAPPEVRAAVGAARAALDRRVSAVRWTDPEQAHLTLQFLGATEPARVPDLAAALAGVAAGARPLTLRTEGLGVFPSPARARVVWLGLVGQTDRLAALQAAVVAATGRLGFAVETRAFRPHLTLGRLRDEATNDERVAVGQAVQAVAPPPPVAWPVDELALMVSTLSRGGAVYHAAGRWRLGGVDA